MAKKNYDVTTVPFLKFIIDAILVLNLVYYGLYVIDRYVKDLSVLMSTPLLAKFIVIYNPFYISIFGLACIILLKSIGLIKNYTSTALLLMILSFALSFVFRW